MEKWFRIKWPKLIYHCNDGLWDLMRRHIGNGARWAPICWIGHPVVLTIYTWTAFVLGRTPSAFVFLWQMDTRLTMIWNIVALKERDWTNENDQIMHSSISPTLTHTLNIVGIFQCLPTTPQNVDIGLSIRFTACKLELRGFAVNSIAYQNSASVYCSTDEFELTPQWIFDNQLSDCIHFECNVLPCAGLHKNRTASMTSRDAWTKRWATGVIIQCRWLKRKLSEQLSHFLLIRTLTWVPVMTISFWHSSAGYRIHWCERKHQLQWESASPKHCVQAV